MPYTHYDRLTALDASFLELETPAAHMHVGSVGIFDAGPLATPEGGVDFGRVFHLIDYELRRVPRFRQKLSRIPVTGAPVWVDDERFNLLYHLRHTGLPHPGDERQLKRLAGRIMSQELDLAKPLWEMWIVEGLEGGRFAVISKVHHALIDGISGVDLLAAFMGFSPDHGTEQLPDHRWIPRPKPGTLGLLGDELARRATLPFKAVRAASRALGSPRKSANAVTHAAGGFGQTLLESFSPASDTPFNVPIGPHRRFDWTRFDMGVIQEVRNHVGGTLNDVVLSCVSGAVRTHLAAHGVKLSDMDFRVLVPVSTRRSEERGRLGNRVSMLVAHLPVDERDARRRVARVIEETRRLKSSGQIEGASAMEDLSDLAAPSVVSLISRFGARRRTFNMVVTNVPGPQAPVYLSGARMLASYPVVPLFENQALGVALLSYDGEIFWGFNSDWDTVPDLHDFVLAVEHEFEVLRKL